MKEEIYVLSNDKIFFDKKKILIPNNDLNIFLKPLFKKFKINLICRKSKIKQKFSLKIRKIKIYNYLNLLNIKIKKINLVILTVTPFNFIIFLLLKIIFRKNFQGHLIILSDGYKEYKYKLGYFGYFIYHFMFSIMKKKLKIISVSKNFTNLKVDKIISPNNLDLTWYNNIKTAKLDKIRMLYIGRFKIEKGIYSFLSLLNNAPQKFNYELKAVGLNTDLNLINNSKITYVKELNSSKKIKKFYDWCNIFVLPSYTEGSPRVVFEALSRSRPVIIFEEIEFLKKENKGIFVSKRNFESLNVKINYIMKNYKKIQKTIKLNNRITFEIFSNNFIKYFI